MNAVNSVQLFILVWTFTPVFQSDVGVISVICEDVTGTVGEEVTFTCNVTVKSSKCCIQLYKFQYPEKYNDSTICGQNCSCEQRNSFTCRYTPTTAMTERFRFFVQTPCGYNKPTEFTVNIREPNKPEPPGRNEPRIFPNVTDNPGVEGGTESHVPKSKPTEGPEPDPLLKLAVIAAVVSGFIIVIVPIIYKMKQKYKQKRRILENHHDVVQWSDITGWNTKALTFV